jgi:hypothetical protein
MNGPEEVPMSARQVRGFGSALSALVVAGAVLVTAPTAWAAAPSNDNRADATLVDPPQSLTGTLVEATLEATDDSSSCGATDGSVWYHFTAPPRGSVVIQFDAGGAMDATVDLYKQVRSKLTFVDCDYSDSKGKATIDRGGLEAGADYAIRVGNDTGSVADTFRLRVLVPTAPPHPPGRHLPAKGVRNHVDRVLNSADTYWTKLKAGRTMRLSLRSQHCTSLTVFGPGTTDFAEEQPERGLFCGGYALFTPTESGRHFLVVQAARDRDVQHYRLQVAPAGRDDTAPGILIANHAAVKGHVNGGIDTRDLYRFDVTHRSALTLGLSGLPTMTLVRDDGSRFGSGNEISRHVGAGRYVVAVSGSGHYTLRLALKTITRATLRVNHRQATTIGPKATARLSLKVRPTAIGPSVITVERFDPIAGWQFLRSYHPRVSHGSATVRFKPPSIGRYRASASYLGSRDSAPSDTGLVWLRVQRKLGDPQRGQGSSRTTVSATQAGLA